MNDIIIVTWRDLLALLLVPITLLIVGTLYMATSAIVKGVRKWLGRI